MKNQIQSFNFESQSVRVFLDENNNPLFVAKDVATTLGYVRPNDAIKQHCKGAVNHRTLSTNGGNQKVRVIYEPDVYRLIFGSKLESAEKFQNWVFDEVLPSIRKTGSYSQKSTAHDRTPLRQAVTALTAKYGIMHDEAYRLVHQYMGVDSIDEIPMADLPKAVAYVHSLIIQANQSVPTQSYLTQKDLLTLAKVMDYARLYADFAPKMMNKNEQNNISTMYAKNANKDDDGFFVCYRPNHQSDINKAFELFIDLAKRSSVQALKVA